MRLTKRLLAIFLITIAISSCVSKKEIVYFQNDEIEQANVLNSYNIIFKPDDLLQITISALDLEAVKPFNLSSVTYASTTNSASGQPIQQSYLIDNNGFIDFPLLGNLKIAGLTRSEAIKMFKEKLDPDYVKNPTINIKISNFTITVLGEVKKPGLFTVPNERITILEALGLANDATLSAKRENVLVTRENNGSKKQYRLDLRSNKIFSSPAYYLQQNDVVYVEPNKAVSQNAAYNKNAGLFISIGSIIISLITILTR